MYEAMVCRLFRHIYGITIAIESTSLLVHVLEQVFGISLILLDAAVEFTRLLYGFIELWDKKNTLNHYTLTS